jgi:hypothetical protein
MILPDGWTAEFRIPFSQLRFNRERDQIWGFNVLRLLSRNDELSVWSPVSAKKFGFVSQHGLLKGMDDIKPKRQVEIAPFTVARYEKYEKEEGNPWARGSDRGFDIGMDGKIGITNDLILDFAINPDFGQVEADPSEINLTAFETYFSEKRPFFIEGRNISNFPLTIGDSPWSSDNLFYSRRVGRYPQIQPVLNYGEFAKIPINTRILGAFKLSGKTKKGLSIGIIESVTQSVKARIDDNVSKRSEIAEPMTNYFIARVQQDINQGNALVGAVFTSTYRFHDDNSRLFLPKTATTAGIDYTQYFAGKTIFANLILAASQVEGSSESISRLQISPRRYFHRPDPDYYRYDPLRTSLTGSGGTLAVGRMVNEGLRGVANITWRTPGFELNDVGFLREANTAFQFVWLGYITNKQYYFIRTLSLNANQFAGFDFSGNTLFKGVNANATAVFTNMWSIMTGVSYDGRNLSNNALRGGPSLYFPGALNYWFRMGNNPSGKLNFSLSASLNKGLENYSESTSLRANISYRPFNALNISLMPQFSHRKTDLQYVNTVALESEKRYIFGSLDQNTFNLTVRINYSITPDLTIQYYGSPFVSSVLYDEFKKISDPKADGYFDRFVVFSPDQLIYNPERGLYDVDEEMSGVIGYSFSDPNFNFRQFRSNLVIRWEFIPGSTVFIAWNQNRTDVEACDCSLNVLESMKKLFQITPYDVFLLKISYRLHAGNFKRR